MKQGLRPSAANFFGRPPRPEKYVTEADLVLASYADPEAQKLAQRPKAILTNKSKQAVQQKYAERKRLAGLTKPPRKPYNYEPRDMMPFWYNKQQ